MKSKALLDSFTAYCQSHPDERFWQALRNWCGWSFLYVCQSNDPEKIYMEAPPLVDTFSWEDNQAPIEEDEA